MKPFAYVKHILFLVIFASMFSLFIFAISLTKEDDRNVSTYVPSVIEGDVPLFIVLHGSGGSGEEFYENSKFNKLAEKQGFIVSYPDGLGSPSGWNAGSCCDSVADDVSFLKKHIESMIDNYSIDASKIYVVGFSNGGMMAYRLGCELSDIVSGIGVVAGTLGITNCTPNNPVSLIHIHGNEDVIVPILGGEGQADVGVVFTPAKDSVNVFVKANKCLSEEKLVLEKNSFTIWDECDKNTSVEYAVLDKVGHGWVENSSFSTSEFVYDFLIRNSRS